MDEKIIKTRPIFEGRVVKLVVHDVTLPDGNQSLREVVNHSGAAAVVAVDDDMQLLMVRQYRLPAGDILLEIPAGTLDDDEAPEACAARELQEETGYKPLSLQPLGGLHPAPGYTTEFIHLFFTREFVHDPLEQDEDEFVETERVPLTDAVHMVEQGEITDAKSVIGILRAARLLGV